LVNSFRSKLTFGQLAVQQVDVWSTCASAYREVLSSPGEPDDPDRPGTLCPAAPRAQVSPGQVPGPSLERTTKPRVRFSRGVARATQMVGATGFEPATTSTPRRCATGLRYAPTEGFRRRALPFTADATRRGTDRARPCGIDYFRLRPFATASSRSITRSPSMSLFRARTISSRSSFENGSSIWSRSSSFPSRIRRRAPAMVKRWS
jgi:hypothetical protein